MSAALHLGAVVLASGPLILTAFGVGGQDVHVLCHGTGADPGVPASTAWALSFWSGLLLPAVLAGLLLHGPRRGTLMAVSAPGAVLSIGLFTTALLPGDDPCAEPFPPAAPLWTLVICYPAAMAALLLASRSPLPRRRHRILPWTAAAGAAAWTPLTSRLPASTESFLSVGNYIESFWGPLVRWSRDAEALGLPIVLVALAATAKGTVSDRRGRLVGAAFAAVLLLFALLDVVAYVSLCGIDFRVNPAGLIRWHLLLAAVLILLAGRAQRRAVSPADVSDRSRTAPPGRPREIALAVVIVAGAIWLVVSSFAPTSP
ncbi:hypothetical protein GCM10010466_38380 [Planomonospora alba]|uniref:DUF998 domain-containing protein n=1 Tax=Planomonospora alba TaxID=161354 RepID=A0ABP6NCF9_9ACTN